MQTLGLRLAIGLMATIIASATAQARPSITRGHRLAVRQCSACHAIVPGTLSPNRRSPQFQDLSGQYVSVSLMQKLTEIAETGHYDMPARRLHQDEVEDLVAYLDSLKRRKTRHR